MIPITNAYDFHDPLPAEVRSAIDAASRFQDLPRGSRIMHKGEVMDQIHQVLDGEVKVSSTSREGRETVLALIRRGGWVALSEVFSCLPATADVTALTPIRVRSVDKSALLDLMRRHPSIAEGMLRVLSLRFSLLYHLSVDRSVLTLKERVVKTLYMQACSHGLPMGQVRLMQSQEELGKLLGAGRQALNRVLKELEREGLVTAGYGGIHLRGIEVLRERYGYLIDVDEPMAVYGD